jgi:alpha-tubulin suppressor-like RCC1 family protein
LNDTTVRLTPNPLPSVSNAVQVAAGSSHSIYLTTTGFVYTFGLGMLGQLGLGNGFDHWVPILNPTLSNIIKVAAGYYHSLALSSTGQVWSFGYNTVTP